MDCNCQKKPDNFGGVLSGGIQDVSALLPLLGTEQCEQQVGSALEKGWLCASATILSLFGCLGIARVGGTTLLATLIVGPFYGAKWLSDAGFSTFGSVSSVVTLDSQTGQYGAEAALEKLLKEKHINDVNLVKGVAVTQRAGGDEKPASNGTGKDTPTLLRINRYAMAYLYSWNTMLLLTSLMSAVLGCTPYLYLMNHHWNRPLSWVFPLLRTFGSSACVVSIQRALQRRIQRIADMSLAWMKRTRQNVPEKVVESQDVLERRISGLLGRDIEQAASDGVNSPRLSASDDSQQIPTKISEEQLLKLLKRDWGLLLDQIVIFVSVPMIVAGYVGCFSLVGQSDATGAPYFRLVLESVLSIIRMFLWGWNPGWDEGTGLTLLLDLKKAEKGFPRVTSPCHAEELGLSGGKSLYTFLLQTEADFLRSAAACVGPLQRFESNAPIALFYSILIRNETKRLYTTISLSSTRRSITFTADEDRSTIFETKIRTNALIGTVYASTSGKVLPDIDPFISTDLYKQVLAHSQSLSKKLFRRRSDNELFVKWNLIGSCLPPDNDNASGNKKSLHDDEKRYCDISSRRILKSQVYISRGIMIATRHMMNSQSETPQDSCYTGSLYDEALLLAESFLLECMIYEQEKNVGDEKECIQAMQLRVSKEKEEAVARYREYSWGTLDDIEHHMTEDWDRVLKLLIQIRISKEHNSVKPFLEAWNNSHTSRSAIVEKYPNEFWHRTPLQDIMSKSHRRFVQYVVPRMDNILESGKASIIPTRYLRGDLRPETTLRGPYVHAADIDTLQASSDWHQVTSLQLSGALLLKVVENYNGDSKQGRRYNLPQHITTLIVVDIPASNRFQQALIEIARSNRNLICLSTGTCDEPIATSIAIRENREWWRTEALTQDPDFASSIGFESCTFEEVYKPLSSQSHLEDHKPHCPIVEAYGDHIKLNSRGRCSVLFCSRREGKMTILASIHTHHPMRVICTIQSDQRSFSQVFARTKQSSGLDDILFDIPNIPSGCGEVLISAVPLKASGKTRKPRTYWFDDETNPFSHTWEIHGLVKIEWTAAEGDSPSKQTGPSNENAEGDDKAKNATIDDVESRCSSSMGQHRNGSAHIEDTETRD
ncbi:hypothetical protein VNI00_016681 [Paramarasmius palmivorus]|uniref:Uncharacterized protein n=1 Tax=Paramarasmius palmivorus TaxID=297713 RepID=A0AAW0BBM5_9AGAR